FCSLLGRVPRSACPGAAFLSTVKRRTSLSSSLRGCGHFCGHLGRHWTRFVLLARELYLVFNACYLRVFRIFRGNRRNPGIDLQNRCSTAELSGFEAAAIAGSR